MSRVLLFPSLCVLLGGVYLAMSAKKPAGEVSVAAVSPAKTPATGAALPLPRAQKMKPVTSSSAGHSLESVLDRARELADAGKTADALKWLRGQAAASPQNSELHWHLGAFLQQEVKDHDGALAEFRAAYLANPADSRVLQDIAYSLRAKGNAEAAATFLEQLRQAVPQRAEPALALSDLFLDHNQSQRALPVLEAARAAHPDDPQILDRLAEAYGRRKEFAKESAYLAQTETLLDQAIASGSGQNRDVRAMERDRASLVLDKAASLADQGRSQEALAALQTVTKKDLRKNDTERFEQLWQGVSAQ